MKPMARKKIRSAVASRNVTPAAKPGFGREEIAHLAYLNWLKDGCPPGRDLDYWLEAEWQLKATWHLLVAAEAAAAAVKVFEGQYKKTLTLAFAE